MSMCQEQDPSEPRRLLDRSFCKLVVASLQCLLPVTLTDLGHLLQSPICSIGDGKNA